MNPLIQLKTITRSLLITLALLCFGLLPRVQAVVPPPDGGYPNFNTAEGQNALFGLTTGVGNAAVGWYSLFSNTDGSFNTAVGVGALVLNVGDQAAGEGVENTAVGTVALLFNTSGSKNTAVGTQALFSNTTGIVNTATGYQALFSNTTGTNNTASGRQALFSNTTGSLNTATGVQALNDNIDGVFNTATGVQALSSNTTGDDNTANGYQALNFNTTGAQNTATGVQALKDNISGNSNTATGYLALPSNTQGGNNTATGGQALNNNTTGSQNTATGYQAGFNITGDRNVCIGAGVSGAAGIDDTTWIRNVYASVASGRAVYVNSDNKIGTLSSSRRYKEDIKPMDKASEALFALKPVTFCYNREIDRTRALSFGLIAEEVVEISPDLITCDKEGKPETVRYDAVNAMLLNEFLKEHRKVQDQERRIQQQETTITQLKKEMETVIARLREHDSKIEKVTAQIELSKPGAEMALNNP
jgi:trimeric autotransporter adhesin